MLRKGLRARILGYEPGSLEYRHKLLAMGLTRGTELEVIKAAPLGDPVQIRVRGYTLTLRKSEAAILRLEELP